MKRSLMKRSTVRLLTCLASTLWLPAYLPAAVPQDPTNESSAVTDQQLKTLIKSLKAEDVLQRRRAVDALRNVGPAGIIALPELTQTLSDEDPQVVKGAATAIGSFGPMGRSALPALVSLLSSDDDYLVHSVSLGIGAIGGPDNKRAVKELLLRTSPKLGTPLIYSSYAKRFPQTALTQMVELLSDRDEKTRNRAVDGIGYLVSYLHKVPMITLTEEQRNELGKQLFASLNDESLAVRYSAARALISLDPEYRSQVTPQIIEALAQQQDGWQDAAGLLRPVPAKAIPELLAALEGDQFVDPINGTLALAYMADQSQPALQRCLQHDSATVRIAAAKALGWYTFFDYKNEVTGILLPSLDDPNTDVQLCSAESIASLQGDKMSACVPVLTRMLSHEESGKRARAAESLQRVGKAAHSSVAALQKTLADPDLEVRYQSALALVAIDKNKAAVTLPVLARAMTSGDPKSLYFRNRAVQAAGELGPISKPIVGVLESLLEIGDDKRKGGLAARAAEALIKIDPAQAPVSIEILASIVTDPKFRSSMARRYSIEALVRQSGRAQPAVASLAELAALERGSFRIDAAVARVKIDCDQAEEGWDVIREKYLAKDDRSRRRVLRTMLKYDVDPTPLLPELSTMVAQQPTAPHVLEAVELIGTCGPAAAPAIPALTKLLDHSEVSVRDAAQHALSKIQ